MRFPCLPVRACSSLALLCCGLSPLVAQTLPEVVVTATRTERPAQETLVDQVVIDAAEIARSGATSLTELLRARAGVEISQNGGPGAISGVFLRGTKTAQTLVLVDGVRMENPAGGGANLEYMPLSVIERVEVIRGPASALYGSAAIGGVIQIFTRGGTGPSTSAQFALGTQGSSQGQAGFARETADGRTRLNASVSAERTGGFEATRPGSPDHQVDRDGHRRVAASAGLSHRLAGGWHLSASALATDGRTAYDDTFSTPQTAKLSYRTSTLGLAARGPLTAGWITELRLGQSGIDYAYQAFSFAPRTASDSLLWLNTLSLPAGRLEIGLEHLAQRMTGDGVSVGGSTYVRSRRRTDAGFAAWELVAGDHRLRMQVRHDHIETVGAEPTAAIGWGWQWRPGWRLRASWASSFRAPTFDDLYSPFGANPSLRPERGQGAEIAVEHRGAGGAGASLVLFENRIRDAIELDGSYLPRNLARARVQGASLSLTQPWAGLRWQASATVQDARGERDDAVGTSQRLARRARVFGVLGAQWQQGPWIVDGRWTAQGDRVDTLGQKLAGYGIVDLTVSRRIDARWELFARAGNLGDRDYQTAAGYVMPGRTLWAGLRFSER